MNTEHPVNAEFFAKRLADLCLRSGMSGLPKDELNQHVLFRSMLLGLDAGTAFTEQEINARLARWIAVSQIKELDHVLLRRRLVDAGYLERHPDGTGYRVAHAAPGQPTFSPDVNQVDMPAVLEARRQEMAERKKAFLARSAR